MADVTLSRPPKPISEMTEEELDDYAGRLFSAISRSAGRPLVDPEDDTEGS